MKAIIKKELRLYFNTPVGYVFVSVFLCISAILFTVFNLLQSNSSISVIFSFLPYLFVIMIPLLTMKSIAEERSLKTDQLLLTSPVSVSSIVWGKLLAAISVFGISLILMLIFPVILEIYSDVEWGVVFTNYIGFFLLGSAFAAIGIFISSITENQLIAGVVTIATFLVLFILSYSFAATGVSVIDGLISVIAVAKRFDNFYIGIINIKDVVYYLSIIAIFSILTVYRIEKLKISK